MRLVWLELNRYGRFVDCSLNLDARVVALLGANEAGKTTVLRALEELGHDEPIDPRSITRGTPGSAADVCEAWFLLDDAERRKLAAAVPEATVSRWYVVRKARSGTRTHSLEPEPVRDQRRRSDLSRWLEKLLATRWAARDAQADLRATAVRLQSPLRSTIDPFDAEDIDQLRELGDILRKEDSAAPKARANTLTAVERLLAYENLDDPSTRALNVVSPWQPDFLLFDSRARIIESTYDLEKVAQSPPYGLRNLTSISNLSLRQLRDAAINGRPEVAEDLTEKANAELREILGKAWGQSRVEVRFATDSTLLHVMVRADEGALYRIAERSEGLKIFVALVSFLVTRRAHQPILLIDEAEQHLHWDAQADLVGMLHRQDQANQVIYTTHSPGCLPQDLGAGIRLLMQKEERPDRSRVVNSIWSEGAGFTPLLLGIGASTAAITPARRALVAEGGTDFLLLPRLFREAQSVDFLDFQVVPGLAEAGEMDLAELDVVAARVAYLTDGDAAGSRLRTKLIKRGVSDHRIVRLPGGVVVEDLVDSSVLHAALAEELRRSGGGADLPFGIRDIPAKGRSAWITARLRAAGINPPPKARVAARILEVASPSKNGDGERRRVLNFRHRRTLVSLLRRVHVALELELTER